ncbi:MAG: DUF3052 domain-containing protein [Acidobacteriota bacterium]
MMPAGYSGTPLAKKLGIKAGTVVVTIDAPESYRDLLGPLPEDVSFAPELGDENGFIHVFVTSRSHLEERFSDYATRLRKDGILWISWPKKSAKIETDLSRDVIREIGLEGGLVDTKVCAVDETWSGLKFQYRLRDR